MSKSQKSMSDEQLVAKQKRARRRNKRKLLITVSVVLVLVLLTVVVSLDGYMVVASISPDTSMSITISVDEMDILSIKEGQSAVVTLDAFPGQSFEGAVESVNLTGTNSGGSTKYEAVIEIARVENMLAGMNASVKITVDTKENVLVISENALIETEDGVFVYTGYNEEKDSLFGNPGRR